MLFGNVLHKVIETFQLEQSEGFDLPDWLKPELYEKLKRLDAEYFNLFCASKRFIQINAGPLFYDFSDKMQKLFKPKANSSGLDFGKVNGGSNGNIKLTLYSGTDIVISNLLVGLQAFDPIQHLVPPPASTLIIELHQAPNQTDRDWDESSFVKVLYFNETVHPITSHPHLLQNSIVKNFLSSISDLALNQNEWIQVCYGLDERSTPNSDRTILLVIIIVLAVLIGLLPIVLCIIKHN